MASWWRRDPDREIDEEFETHLALETERQIENGVPAHDARDAATRRFGNVLRYREDTRAVRGIVWWEHLHLDLRVALRGIARRRFSTSAAIAALGVGMGGPAAALAVLLTVSTAVFSGIAEPDRVLMISETPPRQPAARLGATPETFEVWRGHSSFVQHLSAMQDARVLALAIDRDLPQNAAVQPIRVDLLPLLGVAPAIGRGFVPADEHSGSSPIALISHALWQQRFGGRADIAGVTVTVDGRTTTIVGVMPRGFWFGNRDVDLWVPLPAVTTDPATQYRVVARMRQGDTRAQVAARFAALAPQVAAAQPAREGGWGVHLDALGRGQWLTGDIPPGVLMLIAAVTLGLVAACANIAMVIVARGAARQKEAAVRSALGAGRSRLVRQFLTESIVVALLGGATALIVAYGALRLIAARAPADLASAFAVSLDWRLIVGVGMAALLVGILSGLAPAIMDSRVSLVPALKEAGYFAGAPARSRLRRILILSEVAITVMLLASVGLLIRGVMELEGSDVGFATGNLLVVRLDAVQHIGRPATPPPDVNLLLERIGALEGVEAVATAHAALPNMARQRPIRLPDAAGGAGITRAPVNAVSESYFETLGLQTVDGRAFSRPDRAAARTAIVSAAFARRHYPGGRVLGKTLRVDREEAPREIAGVVSDVRLGAIRSEPVPVVYVPFSVAAGNSADQPGLTLIVRTTGRAGVMADIREVLHDVDRAQTISSASTVEEMLAAGRQEIRLGVYMTAPILLLAMLLTVTGIYGLLAQSVAQRTHELAVRVALGAGPRDLLRLVVAQGLKLAAAGAAVGAAGALLLDRVLGSFLFGVTGEQPVALAGAALLVVVVTIAASIVPCRRAIHIDPSRTLKYE